MERTQNCIWIIQSDFALIVTFDSLLNPYLCLQVGPTGKVVGIDHIPELVQASLQNLRADDPELLDSGRVKLIGESLSRGV